jgi:hypothetical protein
MFKILLFLILVLPCEIQAQGLDNFWLLGYGNSSGFPNGGTNIDYLAGFPFAYYYPRRIMEFDVTESEIADSSGKLLFYTNGAWIANAHDSLMSNGDSLNPSSYTTFNYNHGLIIPFGNLVLTFPNHPNQYILFHETINISPSFNPGKVYYSIINMQLNNGLGAVEKKNEVLFNDTLSIGQLTACKHANGRDWWLVVPEYGHPAYYVYLITPDTMLFHAKQNIGTHDISEGQAAFSPDGTKYACYDTYTDLEVFDFDRCDGVFSNPRHVAINDSMLGSGVSFSPNSKLVYASSILYLYQFDLTQTDLQNTYQTVAVWDSFYSPFAPLATYFYNQLLAPDNKIYAATWNSTRHLHIIDQPDSVGLACNVIQHGLAIPTFNDGTVPNHPNYFLGPVTGSICDSLTTGIKEKNHFEKKIKVYPNPANGITYLQYEFDYGVNGWVELYDVQGKFIYKQRLYWSGKQLLLHTDNYVDGLYAVYVHDDVGNRVMKKLLIQH